MTCLPLPMWWLTCAASNPVVYPSNTEINEVSYLSHARTSAALSVRRTRSVGLVQGREALEREVALGELRIHPSVRSQQAALQASRRAGVYPYTHTHSENCKRRVWTWGRRRYQICNTPVNNPKTCPQRICFLCVSSLWRIKTHRQ